jgi:hypothetical protein
MANTSGPFGFRQFGHRDGSAPTMGLERRFISSGATFPVFTGDTVVNSTTAPYIVGGGSTTAITTTIEGVFQGCEYYNTNVGRVTWSSYWPGSGATGDVTAYICSDPEMTYISQGSTGGVLGSTVIGFGIPMSITGSSLGNTLSGQSVQTVQSSLVTGLTSNAQFVIVDLYSNFAPAGVNGTSTGAEGWQTVVVQPINMKRRTMQPPAAQPATYFTT